MSLTSQHKLDNLLWQFIFGKLSLEEYHREAKIVFTYELEFLRQLRKISTH